VRRWSDEAEAGAVGGATFPTGNHIDLLDVPGLGRIEATLINAGNPTVFVDAASLGLKGTELRGDVNGDKTLLARAEAVRAQGAVAMGDAATPKEATTSRPHTPKLAFVARPAGYTASDGRTVDAALIDLLARIFSMRMLHHAMTGTGAVAIAAGGGNPRDRRAPCSAGRHRRPRVLRPPVRHLGGGRRSARGGQSLEGEQGPHEPLGAPPDGRLGVRAANLTGRSRCRRFWSRANSRRRARKARAPLVDSTSQRGRPEP
jgi:hypothetical protein